MPANEELLMMALQRSIRHDGGTPTQFLESIDQSLKAKLWKKLGFDSFIEMVESDVSAGGIGISRDRLKQIIKLEHKDERIDKPTEDRMIAMRLKVADLLTGESLAEPNHTGNRHSRCGGPPLLRYTGTNDTTYIRKRLKRDEPHLYEQVTQGILTPHQAGKKAGFVKNRQRFDPNDVHQTARQLRKYLDTDQLTELIKLLNTPG